MTECVDRLSYWKAECRYYKHKYLTLKKDLESELRDPSGTIWEHAKRLQDENDRLKEEVGRLKEDHYQSLWLRD